MRLLIWILAFVSVLPSKSTQDNPTLEQVLRRTTQYADNYTKRLGTIVGEERYVQSAKLDETNSRERITVADFRTTPIGDEWFGMRRVREVDGIEIDPRFWGRLGESFDLSTEQGRGQMERALASENARFNLGDFYLTNVPTFALDFFRPKDMSIYNFTKAGEETVDGLHVWKIDASTRNPHTGVLPVSGNFWVEPISGRLLHAEVDVRSPYPDVIPSLHMIVHFRFDPALGMLLPESMDEQYEGGGFPERNIKGHAVYSNFHVFGADVRLGSTLANSAPASDLVSSGENTYSIKLDVPVVTVEAWVTKNNVPALDLKAADFEVTENNVRQVITNFSSVNTPFDVLLLFDRSGSAIREMPLMQRAAEGLISQLRVQDRLGLASFGNTLRMITRWTDSREQVMRSFSRVAAGSHGTEFYRSLQHSLTSELLPVQGRRRVLVLLTDGRDNEVMKFILGRRRVPRPEEDTGYLQILDLVRREHVPIYVVALNTDRNQMKGSMRDDEYVQLQKIMPHTKLPQEYLQLIRSRLEEIAEVSGGHILFPKNLAGIVSLYRQIGEEIGTAYSIGYVSTTPPGTSGYRGIKVSTRDNAFRIVQSRAGYMVP
jgi:VWFA-related protein